MISISAASSLLLFISRPKNDVVSFELELVRRQNEEWQTKTTSCREHSLDDVVYQYSTRHRIRDAHPSFSSPTPSKQKEKKRKKSWGSDAVTIGYSYSSPKTASSPEEYHWVYLIHYILYRTIYVSILKTQGKRLHTLPNLVSVVATDLHTIFWEIHSRSLQLVWFISF